MLKISDVIRSVFAILLLAGAAAGQSLNVSVSPAAVYPGGTAVATLTFADATPSANIAGVEWTLSLPAGVTAGTPAAGAATTGTSKVISCNQLECIDVGSGTPLNVTAIAGGVVATIPLTVPATAAAGPGAIALSSALAANTSGVAVPMTTSAATLTVLSRYDLNSDGVVDGADVQIALNEALGASPCTAPFSLVDGKCGPAGAVLEILAALGLVH